MMKHLLLSAAALLLVVGTAFAQEFESGKVRIKFKQEMTSQLDAVMAKQGKEMGRTLQARNGALLMGIAEVDAVHAQAQAIEMTRVFRPAGKFEARHREWGLHLWYEISYNSKAELKQIMNAYGSLQSVEIAERVNVYSLVDGYDATAEAVEAMDADYLAPTSIPGGTPNDPSYNQQWGWPAINAAQAWEIETGNTSVVVAIEDQGVDYNHPDLDGNMWTNSGETPGNGVDDDNNGYVDDYYGYNFGNNNGNIAIDYHGTHVGGTVAAETNNGVGVAGAAGGTGNNDGVRLMSLSVFGNGAQGGFDEAFIYAADMGAAISQNSWGGGSQSSVLENAIDYFVANGGGSVMNGGLVVFAAGNDNSSSASIGYPGSYSSCLAVASVTSSLAKSGFSNYGSWVDISAPGSSIYSTYPVSQGSYNSISGTSMACPHVSGVAAQVLSNKVDSGLTITDEALYALLVDNANASSLYGANGSYTGQLGSGMLDAYASLTGTTAPPPPPPACNDAEGTVTLNLLTDNYGSETSWTLKDENGATVASGSGYSNNTSYTEDFASLDGRYTFTINDSYGDGICCSYGSGSYSLVDANGTTLVSGGNFGSSESTDICVSTGGGGGDCNGAAPSGYCSAQGNNVNYEYIDLVQFAGINNSTTGNGGYGDFTSQSGSVQPGGSYTITYSAGFPGTTYAENWKVFIDLNRDGDFADAGEEVYSGSSANGGNYSGSISIPSSAAEGDTRMRVVMWWNTTPNSCGSASYGEVEDYSLNVCASAPALASNTAEGQVAGPLKVTERVALYPVPVKNMLTIDAARVEAGAAIRVLSLSGQVMAEGVTEGEAVNMDVSSLKAGIYVVTIVDGQGVLTAKFIKQ